MIDPGLSVVTLPVVELFAVGVPSSAIGDARSAASTLSSEMHERSAADANVIVTVSPVVSAVVSFEDAITMPQSDDPLVFVWIVYVLPFVSVTLDTRTLPLAMPERPRTIITSPIARATVGFCVFVSPTVVVCEAPANVCATA